MGIDVSVSSYNVLCCNYINKPKYYRDYYIGHLDEDFHSEQLKIIDERITQFMYITIRSNTIFYINQVKVLAKEVNILEKENLINKANLEVIKNGMDRALQENLYLKFEYD